MKQLFYAFILGTLALGSCKKQKPIIVDSSVSVRNTLQTAADTASGGTGGNDLPVEVIFGAPEGTYNLSATVSEDEAEFSGYLEGLYTIDMKRDEINFELVAGADHPIYSAFFRIIEPGTFDRYYFTFEEGHNIKDWSSDNSSVSLGIISDKEIKVEIGEGFDFNPGSGFTISLEK